MHQEAFPLEDISDRPLPDGDGAILELAVRSAAGGDQRRAIRGATGGRAMAAAGVIADFELPADLEAAEPPEARGLRRDEVRLLVSDIESDSIEHARFTDLPRWLSPGDLLVVNTSGTLNAAVSATAEDGDGVRDSPLDALARRLLERRSAAAGRGRVAAVRSCSERDDVPAADGRKGHAAGAVSADRLDRLTISSVDRGVAAARAVVPYLNAHGFPIRYGYVKRSWPSAMYQTVFATEPGSAEMPSAGRPFTPELVTRLVSRGVEIAPLVLHTGVASLENHEPPYEEYYRVPRHTAERVNAARRAGYRVFAVGTTVVRALETVTDEGGTTVSGRGLDGSGRHPGSAAAIGKRIDHRLA